MYYLRLINLKKDNKHKEEDFKLKNKANVKIFARHLFKQKSFF